jgi:hypothetical protein
MTNTPSPEPGRSRSRRDDEITELLRGAIDLHCHSGPSVMPRAIDHVEALQEAAAAGFEAILFKDHYYSVTPVAEMLARHYAHLNVKLLSGVALNNTVGGLNRYAVDHAFRLGGRIIWMPTFSAENHLAHHREDKDFNKKFPTTKQQMLAPTPLRVTGGDGRLLDEVMPILDLIAEHDGVLSSGHLHVSEIWPLFEEAKRRGVGRLLVNHPTFVVDASLEDMARLVGMGAYLEHSVCMFVEGSKFKFFDPPTLKALISAGTIERTILGSDLGQVGNPRPVEGFRSVIGMCLDMGYSHAEIRQMVSTNAARLFGLEIAKGAQPSVAGG